MSALSLVCWYKVPPDEKRHSGTLISLVSIVDDVRACVIAGDGKLLVLDPASLIVGTQLMPTTASNLREARLTRMREAFRALLTRVHHSHSDRGVRARHLRTALTNEMMIAWFVDFMATSATLEDMPAIPAPF